MAVKQILFAILLSAMPALAQQIISPDVQADGRVTFRLLAPLAKEVQLDCETVPGSMMSRGTNGVWSFTTPPLEPDFYAYSFIVNGVKMTDPNNPLLKYNLLNTVSQVHVPGPQSLLWELNNVPHGALHQHFYKSTVSGDDRDFLVYTPPHYDPSAKKHYPVLYLLHGFSDDATGWTSAGRANVILDNLIARGQARPMVVVMPLGYGTMDYLHRSWSQVNDPVMAQRNVDLFTQGLLTEVMPQVEKLYRVSIKPQETAIAGLSMGGRESLQVGLGHPDRFEWIGAFSAGGLTNFVAEFPTLDSKVNNNLHLLWLGCGTDDKLLKSNQDFRDWLTSKDVKYTWLASPGAHSFLVWRRYLGQFVPLLFQDKK